jgi:uncharacterized membrane protein YvbJ
MIPIYQGVEVAKELLSAENVTIIGILLAIIVILLYAVNKKDKQIETLNKYVRENDKENIAVLNTLANSYGGVEGKVDINILKTDKIQDLLNQVRLEIISTLKKSNV